MPVVKKPDKDRYDKIEKYEKFLTSFKSVKTSLKSIVRDQSSIKHFNKVVCRMNRLVIMTYQFLKAYALYCFNTGKKIPIYDKQFIVLVMKTIGYTDNDTKEFGPKSQAIIDDLRQFKESSFDPYLPAYDIPYDHLTQMIEYEAGTIETCYRNHIQEHFAEMVKRYVNIIVDKQTHYDGKNKDQAIKDFNKLKNDILNGTDTCPKSLDNIKNHFNTEILGDFKVVESLKIMAKRNDRKMDYQLHLLELLVKMSIDGELKCMSRQSPEDAHKQVKVINAFPLRTKIIPGAVAFDTTLLISNIIQKNRDYYRKGIRSKQNEVWSSCFQTNKGIFKKNGYVFDHRITTDGISCTILFRRSDLYREGKNLSVYRYPKPKGYKGDKYISDLPQPERVKLIDMIKVGIDPGKSDLIFCTNGEVEEYTTEDGKTKRKAKTFRYSNGRRKEETQSDHFRRRLDRDKKKTMISGKSVKEHESELSTVNSSTCIWANFVKYLECKGRLNESLFSYYERDIHRRYRWYGYINKQRSEAEMLNRFEKTFGPPGEVVVLMGDWSEDRSMRYQEPTKGKSIRKLFKDRGYDLYLVDEFRTSIRLYKSGEELSKFRKDKKGKLVHRLLRNAVYNDLKEPQTSLSRPPQFIQTMMNIGHMPTIINRDLNGSLNIRYKGLHQIYGAPCPWYMDRSNVTSEKKSEKPKCDEDETPIKIDVVVDSLLDDTIKTPIPQKSEQKSAVENPRMKVIGTKADKKTGRIVQVFTVPVKSSDKVRKLRRAGPVKKANVRGGHRGK